MATNADRVRVVVQDRGSYLAVLEGGELAAAFPAHDRESAERWASLSRRLHAEAAPQAGEVTAEPDPGASDRGESEPSGPGGDGGSTWPDWGVAWVWEPTGSEDPEVLAGSLGA